MSFFERYFAALDGPEPLTSLELVSDDVRFAIFWAAGADRRSGQFLGGRSELREFIEVGDTRGWAHHVTRIAHAGDGTEFVIGETRRDDGSRIATFLAAAELDADGRMFRYMVARTPGLEF
jgi:hypothetical protein